jgi:hypothetical protein
MARRAQEGQSGGREFFSILQAPQSPKPSKPVSRPLGAAQLRVMLGPGGSDPAQSSRSVTIHKGAKGGGGHHTKDARQGSYAWEWTRAGCKCPAGRPASAPVGLCRRPRERQPIRGRRCLARLAHRAGRRPLRGSPIRGFDCCLRDAEDGGQSLSCLVQRDDGGLLLTGCSPFHPRRSFASFAAAWLRSSGDKVAQRCRGFDKSPRHDESLAGHPAECGWLG